MRPNCSPPKVSVYLFEKKETQLKIKIQAMGSRRAKLLLNL